MTSLLRRIYECDLRSANIATAMARTGFAYNKTAALGMIDSLRALEEAARARIENAIGRAIPRTKSGGLQEKSFHAALFEELRAPVFFRSKKTRRPKIDVNALRGYATYADERLREVALAELERRRAVKIRSVYIGGALKHLGADERIHSDWNACGARTGRWSSSAINLQQLPKSDNDPTIVWADPELKKGYISGGIRQLFYARLGYTLVWFDFKQLEQYVAAYVTGDEVHINSVTSGDVHRANAILVWGDAFLGASAERQKTLRNFAKNFAFALAYLAGAPTVYSRILATGEIVTLPQVEAALRTLKSRLKQYYKWQTQNFQRVMREGYVYSAILGRRQFVGHMPEPTLVANYPIQATAGDVVNEVVQAIDADIRTSNIDAMLIATVHDSLVAEVRNADVANYRDLCDNILARPVFFPTSGLTAQLGVDWETSDRWA